MVRLSLGRSDRAGKPTRWESFLEKRRARKDVRRVAVRPQSPEGETGEQNVHDRPTLLPNEDEGPGPAQADAANSMAASSSDAEQAPVSSDRPPQSLHLLSSHHAGEDQSASNGHSTHNPHVTTGSTSTWHKSRKTWRQTKRFYRRGGQWLYRCSASKDHLRGSGFFFPTGAADAVEAPPGEVTRFQNKVADVRLYRTRRQPQLGSIRQLARDAGLHEGDEFFIVFDSHRIHLESVADNQVPSSLARAAALVGSPGDRSEEELLECLAHAVGAATGSGARLLYEIYLDRGDDDIAQSLLESGITNPEGEDDDPAAPSVNEEIDRIMELLR